MRVLCDVCEGAEATIVCCADEALLCSSCDKRVHEANNLARKHHRVPLTNQSGAPQCDACKAKPAYFCCIQDRSLLCRGCDTSLHPLSTLAAQHHRFLLTGARVSSSIQAPPIPPPQHENKNQFPVLPLDATGPSWLLDDIAGCYHFKDPSEGSSKVCPQAALHSLILLFQAEEDLEWSPELNIFNDGGDEEGFQEVPQTPSPPTASGLSGFRRASRAAKAKSTRQMLDLEEYLLVPDIGFEPASSVRKRKHG